MYGNKSQMSWKPNSRTFIALAPCVGQGLNLILNEAYQYDFSPAQRATIMIDQLMRDVKCQTSKASITLYLIEKLLLEILS